MTTPERYVWYASYGSNLLEERFLCYIKGGQIAGSQKTYKGCSNKNRPIESKPLLIARDLFFAKSSPSWSNGGVAFLTSTVNPKAETLGKMYLITEQQFLEILQQENDNHILEKLDLNIAIQKGTHVFQPSGWYNQILYLGQQNGAPIFTFTHSNTIDQFNIPSTGYLSTIIKGLKQSYPINDIEIAQYLLGSLGIKYKMSFADILKLISRPQ